MKQFSRIVVIIQIALAILPRGSTAAALRSPRVVHPPTHHHAAITPFACSLHRHSAQQAAGRQQWVAREQGSEAEESTWRSLASQAPPLDVPPHSPFHSPWSCLSPCAQISTLASPRLLPLSIAHRTRHATQCQPKANLQTSLSLPLALGQRKASSKRGEGSRREEAMGAPRAGSRAAASASSTVEVASPSLQALRPLCINAPPPSAPPRLQLSANFTLRPLAAYSPALRVCLAGGGEGCGVSTAIPSRLSPVAVQGGTHTGRRGGGLPGKESPGAAAAALCSLSRLKA
ncbi:unnamed protein product, partial [Closterium sp. NIES-64]